MRIHPITESHWFTIKGEAGKDIATIMVYPRHSVHFVTNLEVDIPERRKGLGRQLIGRVLTVYGDRPLYLHVTAYNDRPRTDEWLIEFYKQYGFTVLDNAPGMMVRFPPT